MVAVVVVVYLNASVDLNLLNSSPSLSSTLNMIVYHHTSKNNICIRTRTRAEQRITHLVAQVEEGRNFHCDTSQSMLGVMEKWEKEATIMRHILGVALFMSARA